MDKGVFGKMLDCPGVFAPGDVELLRQERDSYPYCAPLQVLSLLADKSAGAVMWEQFSLPRVSLYMMDPHRLQELLTVPAKPKPAETQGQAAEVKEPVKEKEQLEQKESVKPVVPSEDFDILKEINAYQEVSFKTAPKSVILTNFLEKDGGIVLDDEGFEEVSVQELAKKSIVSEGLLATESMAVILEGQGKLEQAIAVYNKLMVKYPEKSSIFAARIADAEARLAQVNKEKTKK